MVRDVHDFDSGSPIFGDRHGAGPPKFRAPAAGTALVQVPGVMKATAIGTRARLPLGFVACVCVWVLVLYPAPAEPTPQSSAIRVVTVVPPPIAAAEPPAPQSSAIRVVTVVPPPIAAAEPPAPPLAPTTVHIVLTRGPHRLELDLPLDGKVAADDADAIARIMRCPTSGRTRRIATGTLALLADVAVRFPDREIEIVSAVRAEPDRSRDGVKHSKHWDGHAIDLKVHGAKLAEVRDAMWKNHHDIGVGWYPAGGFIHIDYRPDIHDTAWTQLKPNADNIYHPRWAMRARDPGSS